MIPSTQCCIHYSRREQYHLYVYNYYFRRSIEWIIATARLVSSVKKRDSINLLDKTTPKTIAIAFVLSRIRWFSRHQVDEDISLLLKWHSGLHFRSLPHLLMLADRSASRSDHLLMQNIEQVRPSWDRKNWPRTWSDEIDLPVIDGEKKGKKEKQDWGRIFWPKICKKNEFKFPWYFIALLRKLSHPP